MDGIDDQFSDLIIEKQQKKIRKEQRRARLRFVIVMIIELIIFGIFFFIFARLAKAEEISIMVKLTHYDAGPKSCGKYADGYTATGIPAVGNICAVSRDFKDRLFPLHSIIRIPGYGILKIEDVGGGVKNYQLDILCPSYEDAIQRGVKWVKLKEIKVIRWGK